MATVWKWGYCQSPLGFLVHIFQMDYGSSLIEDVNAAPATIFGMLNHFFLLMHWEFAGIFGFILAAIGFVYLIMQRPSLVGQDPHKPLNTMLISRLWLQPSLFYILFISVGVNAIIEGIVTIQAELDRPPEIVFELLNMGVAELLTFIILLVSSVRGYMYNDRSQMGIFERFSHQTLTMLPKNALVLTVGESLFTGMEYFQIVEDYRSDLDLVDSKMLTHHWWLRNKQKKMNRVKIPKKEYGDGFYKESNPAQIVIDRIDFCKANQQRMIFICGADRDLEEIEKTAKERDSDFEVIPWGHCDQIFIKSNYTFGETDIAKAGSFIERHNTLIKSSAWFLSPPFTTRIPLHLWEYEINHLMWHMKTRLARAAFDAGEEALDNGDIDMALINFDQSYKIYRTEQDAINLNKPKWVKEDEWVPPEWHRNMALIHTRLASHGGPNFVNSYKIARMEMTAFLESAKRLRRRIPWKIELQKIKVLDAVIQSNGAKTIADVEKELADAENIAGSDESEGKQHLPYTNDL
ncbi:Oidioi.mRNA.OKI2018_I69.XSR.g14323.t1.cds [Oikopleura dioica]|uniref:Oidioi.mRNA.OKI2018_I69.XSR.g14323.t1.cds n=1 Tax=Oikopleura dioica TaxID=34765 RepID=A0ABN7SEQ5_OIKDI|nr:Oidioi.mRNA.OKI2018_I69.XSR.g14323.t1.cds [Oikopleura dioica]